MTFYKWSVVLVCTVGLTAAYVAGVWAGYKLLMQFLDNLNKED